MTSNSTYYQILGLPEAIQYQPCISVHTLRSAYRRALLRNHPDKSRSTRGCGIAFSIDQITEAFSHLSDPDLRASYDTELRNIANRSTQHADVAFQAGIEVADLDDLDEIEAEGIWYRGCRCGDYQGFLVRDADLEEAAADGELNVGCAGCSLWLKVLFSVVDDAATTGQINTETKPPNAAALQLL